jgi:hypothetical protein
VSEESTLPFIKRLIQESIGAKDWYWCKPDEQERNQPAVDFLFTSESFQKSVAVEHTTFDGFENQRHLGKIFNENRDRVFSTIEGLVPTHMTIHLGLSPNIFLKPNGRFFDSDLALLAEEVRYFVQGSAEGESRQFKLEKSETIGSLYHRRHNIHLDSNLILTASNPNENNRLAYCKRIKKVLEDKLPKLRIAAESATFTALAIEDVDPFNSCYSFFEDNFRSMLDSIEWLPDFIFYFESDTSKVIEGSIMYRDGILLTFAETEGNYITYAKAGPS